MTECQIDFRFRPAGTKSALLVWCNTCVTQLGWWGPHAVDSRLILENMQDHINTANAARQLPKLSDQQLMSECVARGLITIS